MRKAYTKSALCIASLILCINLHAQNCWSPLGSGTNGFVSVMATYNANLIVAGNFDSTGGILREILLHGMAPLGRIPIAIGAKRHDGFGVW